MRLNDGDKAVSLALVDKTEDIEEDESEEVKVETKE
jgi:hypothetical protein